MRPGSAGETAERGSVLALMPAAVMILLVLGAIAVDFAQVFLAERELAIATDAAASDAAAVAREDRLEGAGEVRPDPERVERAVTASFARRRSPYIRGLDVRVEVVGGDRVRVTARGQVEHIFARGIPGVPHQANVQATSVATTARPPATARAR